MVVCIAGGGVMGVCVAYYLGLEGKKSIIVDRVGIAGAASGRAGGFLAKTWNDGSPTEALTRHSFDLHAELGLLAGTDYRRLSCASISVGGTRKPLNQKLKNVEWVANAESIRDMGNEDSIAQVHPKKFCQVLFEKSGASFRKGVVSGLVVEDGKLRGIRLASDEVIEAETFVFAMGPWNHILSLKHTEQQCDLYGFGLKVPPMIGTKYHSVCLQSPRVLSQAVFFHGRGDLEVYPRPDGEVYVTGLPEAPAVVQDLPGETIVRPQVIQALTSTFNDLSESELPINSEQACHLPSTPDGLPILGPIPDLTNAYLASGLGCWGILLAPASAESLVATHLIPRASSHADDPSPQKKKKKVVDISAFDPARFLRFRWFSAGAGLTD